LTKESLSRCPKEKRFASSKGVRRGVTWSGQYASPSRRIILKERQAKLLGKRKGILSGKYRETYEDADSSIVIGGRSYENERPPNAWRKPTKEKSMDWETGDAFMPGKFLS